MRRLFCPDGEKYGYKINRICRLFCSATETPAIIAGVSLYKINLAVIGKVYFSIKGVSLYQFWCLGAESNHRHRDFQSLALPTELPRLGKIIF